MNRPSKISGRRQQRGRKPAFVLKKPRRHAAAPHAGTKALWLAKALTAITGSPAGFGIALSAPVQRLERAAEHHVSSRGT